jgi:hypothetical protein
MYVVYVSEYFLSLLLTWSPSSPIHFSLPCMNVFLSCGSLLPQHGMLQMEEMDKDVGSSCENIE